MIIMSIDNTNVLAWYPPSNEYNKEMHRMETVGFIGIGTMGIRMLTRLLQAGYPVRAYDILPESLGNAEAVGAVACYSPREAAQGSDVVITIVPNSNDVESAVLGKGGVIEGTHPGQIYIDMSSSSPSSTRKVAAELEKRGVYTLDAPVSGGPVGAEQGTLSILVGGDADVLAKVLPLLATLGDKKKIIHTGGHGAGHTAKAVNNLLFGTTLIATCQALELGVRAGIPADIMVRVIMNSSGYSYSIRKLTDYALSGKVKPGFSIQLLAKDMGIAASLAEEEHVNVDVCQRSREYFLEGLERGWGGFDNTQILALFEEAGGAEVRL